VEKEVICLGNAPPYLLHLNLAFIEAKSLVEEGVRKKMILYE
jgi:hypothetical protein